MTASRMSSGTITAPLQPLLRHHYGTITTATAPLQPLSNGPTWIVEMGQSHMADVGPSQVLEQDEIAQLDNGAATSPASRAVRVVIEMRKVGFEARPFIQPQSTALPITVAKHYLGQCAHS